MKLTELLQSNRPTVSCELFPPKPGTALLDAPSVVRRMAALHPAYMSVTCSAGGSGNGGVTTADMANEVQNINGITALAHLTCVAATRDEELVTKLAEIAREEHLAVGVRMALSPDADLITDPCWGRNQECYSEDTNVVQSLIVAAVQALPERYRQAVYLRYYEGYEPAEIGTLMGCTASQVSTYLYRGKAKLRNMLGGAYGQECLSE